MLVFRPFKSKKVKNTIETAWTNSKHTSKKGFYR